jgi:hypothetical protein
MKPITTINIRIDSLLKHLKNEIPNASYKEISERVAKELNNIGCKNADIPYPLIRKRDKLVLLFNKVLKFLHIIKP